MKYQNTNLKGHHALLPRDAAGLPFATKGAKATQPLIPTPELQRLVAGMVD